MSGKTESVLITGAAGFIGSHVVDSLLEAGNEIFGLDNFDPFYDADEKRHNLARALESPRFHLLESDCRDISQIEDSIGNRDVDVVIHLAAKPGVRPSIENPIEYCSVNVLGTQATLEFARRRGIRRFIFGSSSSVYGNSPQTPFVEDDPVDRPISPYAATKRAGELLCHTFYHLHDIAVIALRFFTVYGPRQRPDLAIRKFAARMLANQPIPVFGDMAGGRDYTWVGDIVGGIMAAVDYSRREPPSFEIINLGGGSVTPLETLISELSGALGIEPKLDYQPPQPGDVRLTYASISKAQRLLEYRPTTPLAVGLKHFVTWLRSLERSSPYASPD